MYLYMNVVILRCRNCGEENWKTYIKALVSICTRRMTLIRRALNQAIPGASNARFLNIFEPFPEILRPFKVENF